MTPTQSAAWCAGIAAAAQMALTNYLAQSVVFGLIFCGYGLGLFGRFAPAPTMLGGPCEWLWRS